jgi:hypothetical protein
MPAFNGVLCNNYTHFSGAQGPITIKPGPGLLHTVTVNTAGTSVTLIDGSNTIAVIGAVTGEFTFDCAFNTNLQITIVGAADVTVNWQ